MHHRKSIKGKNCTPNSARRGSYISYMLSDPVFLRPATGIPNRYNSRRGHLCDLSRKAPPGVKV